MGCVGCVNSPGVPSDVFDFQSVKAWQGKICSGQLHLKETFPTSDSSERGSNLGRSARVGSDRRKDIAGEGGSAISLGFRYAEGEVKILPKEEAQFIEFRQEWFFK